VRKISLIRDSGAGLDEERAGLRAVLAGLKAALSLGIGSR
jgi:hypothetical protein